MWLGLSDENLFLLSGTPYVISIILAVIILSGFFYALPIPHRLGSSPFYLTFLIASSLYKKYYIFVLIKYYALFYSILNLSAISFLMHSQIFSMLKSSPSLDSALRIPESLKKAIARRKIERAIGLVV